MELTYKNVKDFLEKLSVQEYTDEQKKSPLDWDGAKALYKAFVLEHLEESMYDYSPKAYAIDKHGFWTLSRQSYVDKVFIAKSMIEKMGFEEYAFDFGQKNICRWLYTVAMKVKSFHNSYDMCSNSRGGIDDYDEWDLGVRAYKIYRILWAEVRQVKDIALEIPPEELGFDIQEIEFCYKGDKDTRRDRRVFDIPSLDSVKGKSWEEISVFLRA